MSNEESIEKVEEIIESLDFNNPSFTFKPNENHDWKQKGVYLVCKSCEIMHATYIGPDKIMVGLDEQGKPILKNKRDYFDN